MAAGEIDIFGKLIARTKAGKICNAEQVDGLLELIASFIKPEEKEVVNILTYADETPESYEDGDMYINSDTNQLLACDVDEWNAVDPSEGVIYVTADTSHMYLWNGEEFVDATGEVIDNTIYVKNLTTDLAGVLEHGIYTVCVMSGSLESWYTLIVSQRRRMLRPTPVVIITQTLTAQDGWWQRSKSGVMWWTEWVEHEYAYQEEVNNQLKKLKKQVRAAL